MYIRTYLWPHVFNLLSGFYSQQPFSHKGIVRDSGERLLILELDIKTNTHFCQSLARFTRKTH